MVIKDEVDARKEKIEAEAAWEMLKDSTAVYVGRQKRFNKFMPSIDNRDELMSQVLGRSGCLRAPTLKVGKIFLVGFSEDMFLQQL